MSEFVCVTVRNACLSRYAYSICSVHDSVYVYGGCAYGYAELNDSYQLQLSASYVDGRDRIAEIQHAQIRSATRQSANAQTTNNSNTNNDTDTDTHNDHHNNNLSTDSTTDDDAFASLSATRGIGRLLVTVLSQGGLWLSNPRRPRQL